LETVPLFIHVFDFYRINPVKKAISMYVPLIAVKPDVNSVADYFGLPLGKTMNVFALPFRSHNLIFNDWFRDENQNQQQL
jgi:hypothetical protein